MRIREFLAWADRNPIACFVVLAMAFVFGFDGLIFIWAMVGVLP